jgi:aspartate carbamoyltransferase catalytic subunit
MKFKQKDVLGLEGLSPQEINLILDTAEPMKEIMTRDIKKVPTLRGHSVITLFYEPSTRTRTSFELAAKYLGARRGIKHYRFTTAGCRQALCSREL